MKKYFLMLAFIVLGFIIIMPSNVLATEIEVSEKFVDILTNDGKLIINESCTNLNSDLDKISFLERIVEKYNTLEYRYRIENYVENSDGTATAEMFWDQIVEPYSGEGPQIFTIVYDEEKYSDAFQKNIKDGIIEINSSSQNGRKEVIERYLGKISDS